MGDDEDEEMEVERFGDGRDDDSSDDETGRRNRRGDEGDEMDDEEFGDFAMPEVADAAIRGTSSSSSGGMVSGIDPAREVILVKPMPVHPTPVKSGFSSLWPFSGLRKEEGEVNASSNANAAGGTAATAESGASGGAAYAITEEPVEVGREEEQEPVVIGEDGKKIDRAVEAKRRTSIEDPDEDEEVVGGEEIVVQRGAGGR